MIYSDGLIKLEKSLSNIINADRNEELQNRIGVGLQAKVLMGFRKSTSPYGEKWKPVKRKRGKGENQPLIDTGRLRDSISFKLSDNQIILGSNMEYAVVHNEGLAPVKYKRQFLPDADNLPSDLDDLIEDEILNFINDQIAFLRN
ncbi:phage virion morphogenesis protein [Vibrio alginolyticus]